MLKRSIPAGLNFTASGMPYWDTDIAGFFSPPLYANYHPAHKPLVDPGDALTNVDPPIDSIPLFVRAGSIVPMGASVLSTRDEQAITSVRVYPGADADFMLFSDDGATYAYEKGTATLTRLHWDQAKRTLTHQGPAAWSEPDAKVVKIVQQ